MRVDRFAFSVRRPVDIVVVIHHPHDELAASVAALEANLGNDRLIVVDTLAQAAAIGDGDVVVVDPDVRATPGLLAKLRRCVESDARIGMAMPLCDLPLDAAPERIAAAIDLAAVPVYPDCKEHVARCAYLRRRALGELATDAEMPDWVSLVERVRGIGYRAVVCDDAYVATAASSGAPRCPPADGLRPLVAMIASQLGVLANEQQAGVLHVVHPRGGGTEKYIRELCEASADSYRHFFLRLHDDRLRLTDSHERIAYEWPAHGRREHFLRDLCAWLRIAIVHVHSLVGTGEAFVKDLADVDLPTCYSVHDMYVPCPTVYLIDSAGRYCNATTDPAICTRCLAQQPGLEGIDIQRWRERYARFLSGVRNVYAPSAWAARTFATYYPAATIAVAPHTVDAWRTPATVAAFAPFDLPDDDHRHVGILGAIGPEKGARVVEAMADRIRARKLPLRLVVLGYTDRENRHQSDDLVFTVHGRYAREEIEMLCDAYRIALLAFPTIWPETFSYTLSEGWAAGRPALVPPRGALHERVEATGAGWLIEAWPDVDAMLDQLVVLTSESSREQLAAKSALARTAFASDVRAGTPATTLYSGYVADIRAPVIPADVRYAIYEASCRALGVEPSPLPAQPRKADSATMLSRLLQRLRG